jgi:hypothetical protein
MGNNWWVLLFPAAGVALFVWFRIVRPMRGDLKDKASAERIHQRREARLGRE